MQSNRAEALLALDNLEQSLVQQLFDERNTTSSEPLSERSIEIIKQNYLVGLRLLAANVSVNALKKLLESDSMARDLMLDEANRALSRGKLNEFDTIELREAKDDLIAAFSKLRQSLKPEALRTVSEAIMASVLIAIIAPEPERREALRSELQRDRTRSANKARLAENVQEIIECEAREFWSRTPGRRCKLSDTARFIYPKVIQRIATLETVSNGWEQPDSSDSDTKRRQIERIRKRLGRIEHTDE
jgi:hypothetical protein